MKRNLIWFDSHERSYLRVTKEDLVALRVLREMSDSSYGGENYAYLIQEPDAKAFIEAAAADEWEFILNSVFYNSSFHIEIWWDYLFCPFIIPSCN